MGTPDPAAALLEPFRRHPATAGVFADFDGTLSAIVTGPEAAAPVPGAPELLAALASRFARVGVISGRPASFLQAAFGPGARTADTGHGLVLAGLYGMELVDGDRVVVPEELAAWRPILDEVAEQARRDCPGLHVEHKGLAVTLHYRGDPQRGTEAATWADATAARTGLVVLATRKAYELAPPGSHTKGTALLALAADLGAVLFVGDDAADLDAFDALDELSARGAHAVRVAVANDEAPAELARRANLTVDGPAGVLDLFRRLLTG